MDKKGLAGISMVQVYSGIITIFIIVLFVAVFYFTSRTLDSKNLDGADFTAEHILAHMMLKEITLDDEKMTFQEAFNQNFNDKTELRKLLSKLSSETRKKLIEIKVHHIFISSSLQESKGKYEQVLMIQPISNEISKLEGGMQPKSSSAACWPITDGEEIMTIKLRIKNKLEIDELNRIFETTPC